MLREPAAAAVAAEPSTGRTLRLEQRFAYRYGAPIRDLRHRLMTVPPARHGRQVRLDHGVDVDGDPVLVSSGRDAFGNHVVDVRAARVRSGIELRSWAVVAFEEGGAGDGGATTVSAAAAQPFTRPTALTAPGARIVDAAEEAGAGSSGPLDLAERLCRWVHRSIRYEFGITTVATTATEALDGGVGVCQDQSHVLLAACRAAGLAARYVSGHLAGQGGSHAWVEVLVPGRRGRLEVVALDPTHDRRVQATAGYVTVAVGRDYADVAPTSGTFAGPCAGVLEASKVLRPA